MAPATRLFLDHLSPLSPPGDTHAFMPKKDSGDSMSRRFNRASRQKHWAIIIEEEDGKGDLKKEEYESGQISLVPKTL